MQARFDALESRQLLTSVVYADGLAAYSMSAPPQLPADANAVVGDADGASYVTGSFSGVGKFGNLTRNAGSAASDVFVAKLNPTGTVAWADVMGGQNPVDGDDGHAIALNASGDVLVTGWFSGPGTFGPYTLEGGGGQDVFVAELNPNGNVLWAESFGGVGANQGESIALDGAGNIYVGGSFQNVFTVGSTTLVAPGAGVSNGYVMKLTPTGQPLWATAVSGLNNQNISGLTVDAAGDVYSTGSMGDDTTAPGAQTTFSATISLPSKGLADAFVMKQDPNGNVLWVDQFGGPGQDDGTAVALDPTSGDLYATGAYMDVGVFGGTTLTSAGLSDVYLARIDPSGNVLWAKGFGSNSQDGGLALAIDAQGNVYDAGFFMNTMDCGGIVLSTNGSYDGFLAEFDPNGNALFAQDLGGPGGDLAQGVALSGPAGDVTVVGSNSAPMSVASIALPPTSNAFVVQIDPATLAPEPAGDFLDLGYTQPAFYTPSTADWTAQTATGGTLDLGSWGVPGFGTIPLAADFNGDGYDQPSYFDPSTATWWSSQNGTMRELGTFGAPNLQDIPVPADYDGVGRSEIAVFRPSTAQWFIMRPDGDQLLASIRAPNLQDIPVPADYDGTGRAQFAVYRPSTAQWFILQPNGGQLLTTFGWPGDGINDIPIPGDYDGVGHDEPAVFRPSTGQIFVLGPNGGYLLTTVSTATNLAEVPILASIASLIRLGKIPAIDTISTNTAIHVRAVTAADTVAPAPALTTQPAVATPSAAGCDLPRSGRVRLGFSADCSTPGGRRPSGRDAVAIREGRHRARARRALTARIGCCKSGIDPRAAMGTCLAGSSCDFALFCRVRCADHLEFEGPE